MPRRTVLMLAAALACHHRTAASAQGPPAPAGAAALLGTWEYHGAPTGSASRPTLGMGLQVVIAIDSAAGDRFRGRVTLWLNGDVGVDVGGFGPVTGTLAAGGQVACSIPYARGRAEPIRLRARLTADTLIIDDGLPFTSGARFLRTARPTSSR